MIIWFWVAVGFILVCLTVFWPWKIQGRSHSWEQFRLAVGIRQLHQVIDAALAGSETLPPASADDSTADLFRFLAAIDTVVARKEIPEDLRQRLLNAKEDAVEAYRREVEALPPHPEVVAGRPASPIGG